MPVDIVCCNGHERRVITPIVEALGNQRHSRANIRRVRVEDRHGLRGVNERGEPVVTSGRVHLDCNCGRSVVIRDGRVLSEMLDLLMERGEPELSLVVVDALLRDQSWRRPVEPVEPVPPDSEMAARLQAGLRHLDGV